MTITATLKAMTFAFAAALLTLPVEASVPQLKTQAPGYYRLMVGDIEVTALSDGTIPMDTAKLLQGIKPAALDRALTHAFLRNPVEASVNGFLINTGSHLVLVDTGAGELFGPSVGNLVNNLRAAGYQPEQVEEIYITHMHGDHVGGLMAAGHMVFPNATVRACQHESGYWLSKANLDAATPDRAGGFKAAMASLDAYVTAGKFKAFNEDTELVPGVSARVAHGHTPGHTTYLVESKGQKLLLWGDLMHVASVQFPDPSVTILYDSDSKAAYAQRLRIFNDAAKNGYWVAGAHLPFPAFGHLRPEGKSFRFFPANYSSFRLPN